MLKSKICGRCGKPIVVLKGRRSRKGAEAAAMGYPVVMKGLLPDGVHKTEMGLVRLDISDGPAARRTYAALMERMEGWGRVLIQRQIPGKWSILFKRTGLKCLSS